MGGFGSGRHRSWKKRTTESCSAIDTTYLRRWGLLVPGIRWSGELSWTRGGAAEPHSRVSYVLTAGEADGTLRLTYTVVVSKERFDYSVRLVATPCHFGGVRWWFVCPLARTGVVCGRRVRKLYLSGRYFGCRHCHDLTYRSRQESDSRAYALARAGLEAIGHPAGKSVTQLGIMLKALTLVEKRLDRLDT
jgi:hypothetical protein